MNIDILYMVGSRIYLGRLLSIFKIRPANRPDAIVRKVDGGRKNRPKMAYFSRFLDYLTHFSIRYRLEILNGGRRGYGTTYLKVLENLVNTKFVSFTKIG